jgi:hypothetical protein
MSVGLRAADDAAAPPSLTGSAFPRIVLTRRARRKARGGGCAARRRCATMPVRFFVALILSAGR